MASPGESRRVDVGSVMVQQGSLGMFSPVEVGRVLFRSVLAGQLWHGGSRLVIAGCCGIRFGSHGIVCWV